MKKVTCLIIVSLIWGVLPIYSQSSDTISKKYSIGIIGGLNFADMNFPNHQSSDDQEISSLVRSGIGAVLDIRFTENIFARFEPMYLQKGSKIEEGSDPANQPEGQIKSSSIELPILFKYMFGKKIKPYLITGPTIGINLNSEIEFEITGIKFNGDLTDVTETLDLGLIIGAGVQMPIGSTTLFLESKYNYGLINQRKNGATILKSNIVELEMHSDKEEDKYSNRGFQFMAGVLISL
jgi:hypothetical protein